MLGCSLAAGPSYRVVSAQVAGSVDLSNPSILRGGLQCDAGGQCPLLPFSPPEPALDGMAARREATPHLLSHVRGREQRYHSSPVVRLRVSS